MKVVLCEHVDQLGERGQIVTVAPGYARNFLLPQRLALEATPANLKVVEHRKKIWAVKEAKEVSEAQVIADKLSGLELAVVKKAGESGTLYGSVTTAEVAELLRAKGIEVDKRRIVIAVPIKTLGAFEVQIRLHRQVTGQIGLRVRDEQGREEVPKPEPIEEPEEPAEPETEASET